LLPARHGQSQIFDLQHRQDLAVDQIIGGPQIEFRAWPQQPIHVVDKIRMGQFVFHVRKLPDPTAFIEFKDEKGVPSRYRGGAISKATLMTTDGIGAAIDDGLLNIGFKVLGFETVFFDNMGNAVPQISNGDSFSPKQKDIFRKLSRGKRFYISRVRAIGPDGIERKLPSSMEVIVN